MTRTVPDALDVARAILTEAQPRVRTVRICRDCGVRADETGGQVCPNAIPGLFYSHAYVDRPECPECGGRGTVGPRDTLACPDPCDACEGSGVEGGR